MRMNGFTVDRSAFATMLLIAGSAHAQGLPPGGPIGPGRGAEDAPMQVPVAEPLPFVKVRVERSVEPTSAAWTAYVRPVAPAIDAQLAPPLSQRFHWIVRVGVPVQVPVATVSVCPTLAVPVMVGATVFVGGVGTTAVTTEAAVALPSTFVAVTVTRIVLPTSAKATW